LASHLTPSLSSSSCASQLDQRFDIELFQLVGKVFGQLILEREKLKKEKRKKGKKKEDKEKKNSYRHFFLQFLNLGSSRFLLRIRLALRAWSRPN
jgi:hypothetical protein